MRFVPVKVLNKIWLVNQEVASENFYNAVCKINNALTSSIIDALTIDETNAFIVCQSDEDTQVLNILDAT